MAKSNNFHQTDVHRRGDGDGNDSKAPIAGEGDMTKAVYDSNDDGRVDSADYAEEANLANEVAGAPAIEQYYGTDSSGTKGFHDLPAGGGGGSGDGDMKKATYDTDNNGIVDNAEAVGGVAESELAHRSEKTTAGTGTLPNWAAWIADTTGGALSRAMPTSPEDGEEVTVFDVNENAATNNITLTVSAPTTISDSVIDVDGGAKRWRYDASGDVWDVVFSQAPSTGGGTPAYPDYRIRFDMSTEGETAGSQNITDGSGWAYPVTVVGNTNIQADGSVYFDGDGDYFYLDDSDSHTPADAFDVVYEFEINWDGDGDATQSIINGRDASSAEEFRIVLVSGVLNLVTFISGSPDINITGTTTLSSGVWYNVKASRVSGTWDLTLDDVSEGSQAESGTPTRNAGPMYIGHSAFSGDRQFKGYIRVAKITKEFV